MPTSDTPTLIGMVHLPALLGSPANRLPLGAVVEHALTDATTLRQAGFDAVIVENFGDSPFVPGELEPVTIAAMAVVVQQIVGRVGLPVGVNCLRNDARSALGIAASCGAHFIRVNVHTGVAATDQGMIEGKAFQTVRSRRRLCPQVKIYADVHVKHASPVGTGDIAQSAEETAYRGHADAIIVSGPATGRPVDMSDLRRVKEAVPDRPVLIGSGATTETIHSILEVADGVIVGSCLKPGGDVTQPINAALAHSFVEAFKKV